MQIDLVGLKSHDPANRHYLSRYTIVSESVNNARDLINERFRGHSRIHGRGRKKVRQRRGS